MDIAVELRYYEIRFIKLVNNFYKVHKLEKLLTFLEMMTHISEADLAHVKTAMQKVLINDVSTRISQAEYIITLKLCTDFTHTKIRELAKCSPNTLLRVMQDYHAQKIYVSNQFELQEANAVRFIIKGLEGLTHFY